MARQLRHVLPPLTQGRHADRYDGEPVIQVLAEAPGRDLGLQVAVGGGDDAHVHLDPRVTADALEGLVLKGSHDLALRLQGHVAHLVEQQRAAVGALQHARAAGLRRRVGASLDAEQLLLEACRVQRRAVEHHERSVRPARTGVNHARRHLLAGAGKALDQHARSGGRHALNARAELVRGVAVAEDRALGPGAQAQLRVLASEPRRLKRAAHHEQQAIRLERLLDEVVGAVLDRGHGRLDRAVP